MEEFAPKGAFFMSRRVAKQTHLISSTYVDFRETAASPGDMKRDMG
jgi:hypothetical protein